MAWLNRCAVPLGRWSPTWSGIEARRSSPPLVALG
jgi:hypothetical protein